MEGSLRMTFPIPHLLLLLSFLIISTLPSSSTQAATLKCFICSSETSLNCEAGLSSSSDTSRLIRRCSTGKGNLVEPSGCQIFIIQSGYYEYPRRRIVMRDCLYPTDIFVHFFYEFPYKDEPWYSGEKFDEEEFRDRPIVSDKIKWGNEKRQELGLPSMPLKQSFWRSRNVLNYYHHPNSDHWNVSNGGAAATLYPDFYKERTTKKLPVKCFVCSHDDPGCEGQLNSSSTAFIQDCVGSEETTVAIGCTIHAGQFPYPHKTYFYRDCLYENYLRCHRHYNEPYKNRYLFPESVDCLNEVRSYLGLPKHNSDKLPGTWTNPTTVLYFLPGHTAPPKLFKYIQLHYNQSNMLTNGIRLADIVDPKKQPYYPPSFWGNRTFSCHSCDTQTGKCGGDKGEIIDHLPQIECKPPNNDDAFGCMILYSVNYSPTVPHIHMSTRWMRRGCWYNGDLFCIRFEHKRSAPARTLSSEHCPPPRPKPGGKCEGRKLSTKPKVSWWRGERDLNDHYWSHELHEEYRNCLRDVRISVGVNDGLPDLPEYEDAIPLDRDGSGLFYEFCAGRSLCNNQETFNIQKQTPKPPPTTTTTTTTTTSTSTTTTTSTTTPPTPPPTAPPTTKPTGGGGTCEPEEEDPDDDCSDSSKDKSWTFWVLIGVIAISFLIWTGVGFWLCSKKGDRDGYLESDGGYPEASYPPMQQGQGNGNGPVTNSQQAEQGLRHSTSTDSSGSITEDADSEQSVGSSNLELDSDGRMMMIHETHSN